MPVGYGGAAAFSASGSPSQPSHLGRGAGFVDEDQPLQVEVGLLLKPNPAPFGDVRPLLLGGVRGFF